MGSGKKEYTLRQAKNKIGDMLVETILTQMEKREGRNRDELTKEFLANFDTFTENIKTVLEQVEDYISDNEFKERESRVDAAYR